MEGPAQYREGSERPPQEPEIIDRPLRPADPAGYVLALIRERSLFLGLILSGAAGLLYESSWTRMLHQVFGVSDLAVATVLAVFFFGLGLGSALGGRVAHRITRPVYAYVLIEVSIALLAVLSVWVVPAVRRSYEEWGEGAGFASLTLMRWVFASGVLLPPTVLMGATIPVLARLAARREHWSNSVTALYVANTVGAILGAGLAGFWSIPQLGVRASVWFAAAASLAAAAVVGLAFGHAAPLPIELEDIPSRREIRPQRVLLATLLTALSGGAALAGEVLWTRVLRLIVHGTTAAFAAMLVNYLAGIAIGALLAPRLAKRWGPTRAFGFVQVIAVVATAVAMVAVPHLARLVPLIRGAPEMIPHEAWVLLLVSSLLLLPISILTGTGLPLTWAIAEEGTHDASGASGRLLAANTLGGLLGSLVTGFVWVPALGTEGSLLAVAGVSAIAGTVALRAAMDGAELRSRVLATVGPLIVLGFIVLLQPSIQLPFLLAASTSPVEATIEGPYTAKWTESLVFLREGRNTTVTLRRNPGGLALANDGRPESGFSAGEPGFGPELVTLGTLPALFAAQRGHATIIGLGAGHTTAVALATGFDEVTAIELEEAVVEASRILYDARNEPFPLDNPRAHLVVDDARSRLALAEEGSLDAVISQPSHPWLAGSAALYTEEFFREVARALRDDGVFTLWINVFRIDIQSLQSLFGTLSDVFPHVLAFSVERSSLLIAASESEFDWSRAEARFRSMPAYEKYLHPSRLEALDSVVGAMVLDSAAAETLGRGAIRVVDDRPVLEFRLAEISTQTHFSLSELDAFLHDVPWVSAGALERWPQLVSGADERIQSARSQPATLGRIEASIREARLSPAERDWLLGRLAEARGNIGEALSHYEAAATPVSVAAADRLRVAFGHTAAAISIAVQRAVLPNQAGPLIDAAFSNPESWETDEERSEALSRVVAESATPAEHERQNAFEIYRLHGCLGLLAVQGLERATRESAPLAWVAARCALAMNRTEWAETFFDDAMRRRAVLSARLASIGQRAFGGGNLGLAELALRRAWELDSTRAEAPIVLAKIAHRRGDIALARRILVRAWSRTAGFGREHSQIAATAAELGLDLSGQGILGDGHNPSSISTVIHSDGDGDELDALNAHREPLGAGPEAESELEEPEPADSEPGPRSPGTDTNPTESAHVNPDGTDSADVNPDDADSAEQDSIRSVP